MKVVIGGSFRRDLEGLKKDFAALQAAGCEIISPRSLDFLGTLQESGWARLPSDPPNASLYALEQKHLEAIGDADFVWLHAPDGYLGLSGSREIGAAYVCNKPVFARRRIDMDLFAFQTVIAVNSPAEVRGWFNATGEWDPPTNGREHR